MKNVFRRNAKKHPKIAKHTSGLLDSIKTSYHDEFAATSLDTLAKMAGSAKSHAPGGAGSGADEKDKIFPEKGRG